MSVPFPTSNGTVFAARAHLLSPTASFPLSTWVGITYSLSDVQSGTPGEKGGFILMGWMVYTPLPVQIPPAPLSFLLPLKPLYLPVVMYSVKPPPMK